MATSRSRGVVLVVEDDPPTRDFYRSLLRQAGFVIIAAEDGLAALHVVDSQIPDAVVLDVQLPRVSGRDVYHELKARQETHDVPIVIVSGHDTAEFQASHSPLVRIFGKPVDPHTLLEAVETCVRHRRDVETSA